MFALSTLDLYGLSQYQETVVADKDLYADQQRFFARLARAFRQGAEIMEFLFLGLIHLWAVFVLGGLLYLGYKKAKHYKKV